MCKRRILWVLHMCVGSVHQLNALRCKIKVCFLLPESTLERELAKTKCRKKAHHSHLSYGQITPPPLPPPPLIESLVWQIKRGPDSTDSQRWRRLCRASSGGSCSTSSTGSTNSTSSISSISSTSSISSSTDFHQANVDAFALVSWSYASTDISLAAATRL